VVCYQLSGSYNIHNSNYLLFSIQLVFVVLCLQTKNGCFIGSRTDKMILIKNEYETADEYHARILGKVKHTHKT